MAYAVCILVNQKESAEIIARAILEAGLIPIIESRGDDK